MLCFLCSLLHVNRRGTFSVTNTNYCCYLRKEISSFFPSHSGIVIRCACSPCVSVVMRKTVSVQHWSSLFLFFLNSLFSVCCTRRKLCDIECPAWRAGIDTETGEIYFKILPVQFYTYACEVSVCHMFRVIIRLSLSMKLFTSMWDQSTDHSASLVTNLHATKEHTDHECEYRHC
jgi:hypothetical protein